MAKEDLATYLNDHLAGSAAALELLDDLQAIYSDTPIGPFFSKLHADITADREILESVMQHLQVKESGVRQATAWFAGKMTELKLWMDDSAKGALHLFESLEALSLGLEGQKSLWKALMVAAAEDAALRVANYEELVERVTEQRERVEAKRLVAAKTALAIHL